MNDLFRDRRYLIPFRATLLPQIFTDVLVVGSGVAGMSAAIEAGQYSDVIVVTKGAATDSNTAYAQGGISAVMAKGDTVSEHCEDTMKAGAGLCDRGVVEAVVGRGAELVHELVEMGMRLDKTETADEALRSEKGSYALGREGGHSKFRVVHADGDATGKALARTLIDKVKGMESVRLFDQCFVIDLITDSDDSGSVIGVITHHKRYGLQVIWAKATVLASGGCGKLYRESTNPSVATGDGIAMAYRAGAKLADLAFMQFHPTTLYIAGASRALITEAVRGEGAVLVDSYGKRFMPDYHEMADLAPRDIVSRAILSQMKKTGATHVYLDCTPIGKERFVKRFPGITKLLEDFELEAGVDRIPVHPSAHYMIGGVAVDAAGRTSLRGLYAAGEVSCSGLNGANRLASNSLLEGLVYGRASGGSCREMVDGEFSHLTGGRPPKIVSEIRQSEKSELDLSDVRSSLRSVMWRGVGIVREGERLTEVAEMIDFWGRYTLDKIFDDSKGWDLQNMLLLGAMMTQSAMWRKESRGTHYRKDFKKTDADFCLHDIIKRGELEPETVRAIYDLGFGGS